METTNQNVILELISKVKDFSIPNLIGMLIAIPTARVIGNNTTAYVFSWALSTVLMYFTTRIYNSLCKWIRVRKGFKGISSSDKDFLKQRFCSNLNGTTLIKQVTEYKSTYLINSGILVKSPFGTEEGYIGYGLSEIAIKYISKNRLFD